MGKEGRSLRAGAGGLQGFISTLVSTRTSALKRESAGRSPRPPSPTRVSQHRQLTLTEAAPPLRLLARLEASERSLDPQQLDRAFFRQFSLGFRGGSTLSRFRLALVLRLSRDDCS